MPRREDDRPLPDFFNDELERGHARWLARERAANRTDRRRQRRTPRVESAGAQSSVREWLFALAFAAAAIAAIVHFTI